MNSNHCIRRSSWVWRTLIQLKGSSLITITYRKSKEGMVLQNWGWAWLWEELKWRKQLTGEQLTCYKYSMGYSLKRLPTDGPVWRKRQWTDRLHKQPPLNVASYRKPSILSSLGLICFPAHVVCNSDTHHRMELREASSAPSLIKELVRCVAMLTASFRFHSPAITLAVKGIFQTNQNYALLKKQLSQCCQVKW